MSAEISRRHSPWLSRRQNFEVYAGSGVLQAAPGAIIVDRTNLSYEDTAGIYVEIQCNIVFETLLKLFSGIRICQTLKV
jgi:hypothetical protein